MKHDPNGETYEAFIERMAGASPRPCGCDYPTSPECPCDTSCAYCWPDFQDWEPREDADA